MSIVDREKGTLFCPVHPNKRLAFLCHQCNILICNKCIFKEHIGHPGEEVEEVVEKKFGKLDDFIIEAERKTLPTAEHIFQQVEAQVNAKEKILKTGIRDAYRHERYLTKLVKKNTKDTIGNLKHELQTLNQQFTEFKSKSETFSREVKNSVTECKETKKTKNDILVIDVVNGVEQFDHTPPTFETSETIKTFTPGLKPEVDIKNAFGEVNLVNIHEAIAISEPVNTNKTKEQREIIHDADKTRRDETENSNSKGAAEQAPIKNQPTDIASRGINCFYPNSIERLSDGRLCFCGNDTPDIYLIDEWNDLETIDLMGVRICDIAVHPTTDILYCVCNTGKSIRSVDIGTGFSTIMFTTPDNPSCMALAKDETILVGFLYAKQFVNYSQTGHILNSIEMNCPVHISVCANTGTIVVANGKFGAHILNKDFQTMYVYKGSIDTTHTEWKLVIDCFDAVFDACGNLLIGDCNNKEIHVLEANTGTYIETIDSSKFGKIVSMCVQLDGGLVVGTENPPALVFDIEPNVFRLIFKVVQVS